MDFVLQTLHRGFSQSPYVYLTWPAVAMLAGTVLRYSLGKRAGWLAIVPRDGAGLLGILTAPFVHDNFSHLLANLPPFLVLGGLVLRRGGTTFVEVAIFLAVSSGALLWILGRKGAHVGMSGVIFGFLGYLLGMAYVTRELWDLLVAAGVLLVYGGMLAGIKPARNGTSWEGHLFGLLAGLAWVWFLHR